MTKNISLVLIWLTLAVGCETVRVADNVFTPKNGLYKVAIPEDSWDILKVSNEDVTLWNGKYKAMLAIISNRSDGAELPLEVLNNHLLLGISNKAALSRDETSVDGVKALHTILMAELDGNPLKIYVVVLKKDETVFNIVYWADPDHYDNGIGDFESLLKSFRFVKR